MPKDRFGKEIGGAPIGSRQGGAPAAEADVDVSVHRTRTERARLVEDPNANQAGNWRGSQDQTRGSQTGADIDTVHDEE